MRVCQWSVRFHRFIRCHRQEVGPGKLQMHVHLQRTHKQDSQVNLCLTVLCCVFLLRFTSNLNSTEWNPDCFVYTFNSPASKASWDVINLTERNNTHTHIYRRFFICSRVNLRLPLCLHKLYNSNYNPKEFIRLNVNQIFYL